jgi:hypothetical protein
MDAVEDSIFLANQPKRMKITAHYADKNRVQAACLLAFCDRA